MRGSRFTQNKFEITGGRAKISDMKNWIKLFKRDQPGLLDREIQDFMDYHFDDHIIESYENGLNEQQAADKLIQEIKSGNNQPTEKGIEHIRHLVSDCYKTIKEGNYDN